MYIPDPSLIPLEKRLLSLIGNAYITGSVLNEIQRFGQGIDAHIDDWIAKHTKLEANKISISIVLKAFDAIIGRAGTDSGFDSQKVKKLERIMEIALSYDKGGCKKFFEDLGLTEAAFFINEHKYSSDLQRVKALRLETKSKSDEYPHPARGALGTIAIEERRLTTMLDIGMNVMMKKAEQDLLDWYDNKFLKSADTSIEDKLYAAGLPEQVIEKAAEKWDSLSRIEHNGTVSYNDTFHITEKNGKRWFFKVTNNERNARMEAAANYYFSQHFDFIAPGGHPEPVEANGLYLTWQEEIPDAPKRELPISYWLGVMAMFHREAEKILLRQGTEVEDITFRSKEEEEEKFLRGSDKNGLKFDKERWADCTAYLAETQYKTLIHHDARRDNLYSSYLTDLEHCGRGHPGIDLAILFMQRGIPEEEWDRHLEVYLKLRGAGESFEEEMKHLKEGVQAAKYYGGAREIISSSLKELRERQIRLNRLVNKYLN
jgi:hypothetical protein